MPFERERVLNVARQATQTLQQLQDAFYTAAMLTTPAESLLTLRLAEAVSYQLDALGSEDLEATEIGAEMAVAQNELEFLLAERLLVPRE